MNDPVTTDRKREEAREVFHEMKSRAAWEKAEYKLKYDLTISDLREQLDNMEYDNKEPVGMPNIVEMVLEYLAEQEIDE